MKTNQSIEKISKALKAIDPNARIDIKVSASTAATPHDQKVATHEKALLETKDQLLKDSTLNKILNQFKISPENIEVSLQKKAKETA